MTSFVRLCSERSKAQMLWKAMVLSLMQIQVVWFYYQNKLSGLPEWGLDNHKNLCRMLLPCMEVVLLCVRPFEEPSWWTMQTSTLHGKPKVWFRKNSCSLADRRHRHPSRVESGTPNNPTLNPKALRPKP